ncbi:MAG: hypothetical protein AUI14_22210 [Actinobacteria bacterium 13_2_20CM_2_71_6]|nr:MAG: hypothetical protein AUI14_22210 [Actinobacteria bacterium 13_2_20CM_2_71_6]
MSPLLTVTGLTRTFGGVRALAGCSFGVADGTVTGLIGPNGSGKTTVFNIVTGYLTADAGRVHFAGRDVTGYDPARLYRAGLSRTFQQARVFPQLTVRENLVAAAGYRWWQLFRRRIGRRDRERADRLLAEFRLDRLADVPAAELSYGQRKLLEHDMGVVMRLCDPVIVLDAGRPVFAGTPEAAQQNPVVLDAYLGA